MILGEFRERLNISGEFNKKIHPKYTTRTQNVSQIIITISGSSDSLFKREIIRYLLT